MCTEQMTSNDLKKPQRIGEWMHKPDSVRKNFFLVGKKFQSGKLCHKKYIEFLRMKSYENKGGLDSAYLMMSKEY